ncbi:MAG: hypothetical protein HUK19_01855 [Fibrobacter sp.]|nr:hypothetical protein [Fibrobacter sp.]
MDKFIELSGQLAQKYNIEKQDLEELFKVVFVAIKEAGGELDVEALRGQYAEPEGTEEPAAAGDAASEFDYDQQ